MSDNKNLSFAGMPKVSVIMPLYNKEKFVAKAIRSVLNQTMQDFELIVVDDCSTDSSLDIVRAIKDTRIRILQNESNSGVSATSNRGIMSARSDILALLAPDDVYSPRKLEKQLGLFEPGTAIYTGWYRIRADDKVEYLFLRTHDIDLGTHIARGRHGVLFGSLMFSKHNAIKAGLYNGALKTREDTDFVLKLLENGIQFIGISSPLYGYRYLGESLSNQTSNQARRESYLWQYKIILTHRSVINLKDKLVRQNLARCLIASRSYKEAVALLLRNPSILKAFYSQLRNPGESEKQFERGKTFDLEQIKELEMEFKNSSAT